MRRRAGGPDGARPLAFWDTKRAPRGRPLRKASQTGRLGGAPHRRGVGASLLRRRGGAVLELLLRSEQCIQHLGAQALAERERETRTHEKQQEPAAALALGPLLRAPQGVRGIAERRRRLA